MATEKQLTKTKIQEALGNIEQVPFYDAMISLWSVLGYRSQRQPEIYEYGFESFKQSFSTHNEIKDIKAKGRDWEKLFLLFQVTDAELKNHFTEPVQTDLFGFKSAFQPHMQSYLFVGLQLKGETYSRTALADIARQINRCFAIPLIITFRYGNSITIAVVNRRANKKDSSRDVLEKVILIKDINLLKPHRAHLDILFELSVEALSEKTSLTNFDDLHKAWAKTLDLQELNKRFYKELSNWYFWAMDKVTFPDDSERNIEILNSTSIIRLITRIVFIWFIKEKRLIPEQLFEQIYIRQILKEFLVSKSSHCYYNAILQNLFFGTLNQKMNERDFIKDGSFEENRSEFGVKNFYRYSSMFSIGRTDVMKLFEDIPFLNGGLFDCLDKQDDNDKYIYIDGFSRNTHKTAIVPDYLFFAETTEIDLNNVYGTKNKKYTVRGLFSILSSYKFTVSENTPIEEEIALDPELLGCVFENLLACYNPETRTTARKLTGSYYTPRKIVDFMVDSTLKAYLQNALIQKIHMSAEDVEVGLELLLGYNDNDNLFNEEETNIVIAAIDACKILDPACGSGAFLMGMLHKLSFILHKLDNDNTKWKDRQIQKAQLIDDVTVRNQAIDDIFLAFESNELDYGRKLYLIENCIYGVDIQPIAVQISKLRLFISLIVDQRFKSGADNWGIRPLPNLETKFVAANTLVHLRESDQYELRNPTIINLEEELKAIRHMYFGASTRKNKLYYQQQDRLIRKSITQLLKDDGWSYGSANLLASFNPYDQNRVSPFFDPEWMFGESNGFHIVVGNPPYALLQNINISKQINNYYLSNYKVAQYKVNLYHLFIEAGLTFLNLSGILSFITPSTFLKNTHNDKLRSLLVNNTCLQMFIIFYDKVFEDPSVDNLVFQCLKEDNATKMKDNLIKLYDINDIANFELMNEREIKQVSSRSPNYMFEFDMTDDKLKTVKQIENNSIPYSQIGRCYFGIQTYDRKKYVTNNNTGISFKPVIDGSNIKRYFLAEPHEYLDYSKDSIKSGGDISIHQRERIVIRQVGKYPVGAICPANVYSLNTVYNLLVGSQFDIYTILGILNSKLIRFYWESKFYDNKDTFPRLRKDPIMSLPFKPYDTGEVGSLVQSVLEIKRLNDKQDTSVIESQIDLLVYKLYNLSQKEIMLIEGNATLLTE